MNTVLHIFVARTDLKRSHVLVKNFNSTVLVYFLHQYTIDDGDK
jgi:hypothetical protein